MGTENLVLAARANGVRKFVFLSTDKAVYPINAYGMSKAVAEKIILAAAGHNMTNGNGSRNGTTFATVRYGNVMGSRGSLIPFVMDCVNRGNPVPITDPEMTRFWLHLNDAIDLVVNAWVLINQTGGSTLHVPQAKSMTIGDTVAAIVQREINTFVLESFGTSTPRSMKFQVLSLSISNGL